MEESGAAVYGAEEDNEGSFAVVGSFLFGFGGEGPVFGKKSLYFLLFHVFFFLVEIGKLLFDLFFGLGNSFKH